MELRRGYTYDGEGMLVELNCASHYARIIPIGRILQPAEIARLVTYLASETGYTGSTVHMNGGLLLV